MIIKNPKYILAMKTWVSISIHDSQKQNIAVHAIDTSTKLRTSARTKFFWNFKF